MRLKMRDLLFKNLTSEDKRRKIIASSEVIDREGVRSVINRHFVCLVREVAAGEVNRPEPYVHVVKEHNTQEQRERFFCKIKGSVCAVSNGKLFLILFMHSLKISLVATQHGLIK
jgi:hypothetical protein